MTPAEQAHVLRFVRGEPEEQQIVAATLALLAVLRTRGACADPCAPAQAPAPAAAWDLDRSYRSPRSWAAPRRPAPAGSL
ncbi:acyl-CoA carboxylase subunit epsilon [Streptomyces sp. NPDC006326]|uniref:acyl-CoA carboxylase subunit epsilon n=1 Tax=Streptomyces sp. NPDC006326 TaxID=3156752 RepID=UPI0033AAF7DE